MLRNKFKKWFGFPQAEVVFEQHDLPNFEELSKKLNAKKAPAKKAPAKKAPAKKSVAKKATSKKTPAKKAKTAK
jgi:topoisomerase IA-like protein